MFSRWLCDGAWDCGRSRSRVPCCGGACEFHLEGLSLVLYSTRAGARSSLIAHLRRSFRRREDRSSSRDAALTRCLSGGAGARASSSCSLVGAALLPVIGSPYQSNRFVGSALAGARVFGSRRSCHGLARRRAGRLLGWCGVACIRVCTFGRRLPSSVVGRPRDGAHRRTCVRMLVARWRSCLRSVSVLSRCAARRRACCVVGCRYTRAAVWSLGGI